MKKERKKRDEKGGERKGKEERRSGRKEYEYIGGNF